MWHAQQLLELLSHMDITVLHPRVGAVFVGHCWVRYCLINYVGRLEFKDERYEVRQCEKRDSAQEY